MFNGAGSILWDSAGNYTERGKTIPHELAGHLELLEVVRERYPRKTDAGDVTELLVKYFIMTASAKAVRKIDRETRTHDPLTRDALNVIAEFEEWFREYIADQEDREKRPEYLSAMVKFLGLAKELAGYESLALVSKGGQKPSPADSYYEEIRQLLLKHPLP